MPLYLNLVPNDPIVHTKNHRNCPACDAVRRRKMPLEQFRHLDLCKAVDVWLEDHKPKIDEETTYKHNLYYIRSLKKFFCQDTDAPDYSPLTLEHMHIGHVQSYVEHRKETAGASLIRHEINVLAQVLQRAGLWKDIAKDYIPPELPPKNAAGKAPTEEEMEYLYRVAASNPRWMVAYCCTLLSAATTMGPTEIRKLTLGDVHLETSLLHVRLGTKNKYRDRIVTLNDTGRWAVRQLLDRARRLGAMLPTHYLLPSHRAGEKTDPEVPMQSWKKSFQQLKREAGKKYPVLLTLRRNDLRHYAITKLLENPNVAERTVIDLAGHVSPEMLKRYAHIRLAPKREATDSLAIKRPPQRAKAIVKSFPQKVLGFPEN